METKNAGPLFHDKEQDKRPHDFATLLLLNLRRKLYDRLKQGCFRLGYRTAKDLLIEKHIQNYEWDDDAKETAELSEVSTTTSRTNSAMGDVFYMSDGQWRSGDWQTLGVHTLRKNSATIVRRRRMPLSSPAALDDDYEARVSAITDFSLVQNVLPWLLRWIFVVMVCWLVEKPTSKQIQKRRKEMNMRKVRSERLRMSPHIRNNGMRAILPSPSSLFVLASSLPVQARRSYQGGSQGTERISKPCVAVARMSKLPPTGLPPMPRMIMSPPTSPRPTIPCKKQEPPSMDNSVQVSENKGHENESIPLKISVRSPKKIHVEFDVEEQQLKGLLSKQFAQQNRREGRLLESQDSTDSELFVPDLFNARERSLDTCDARTMEDVASESMGRPSPRVFNSSKSSKKAHAINMLKQKKARSRELARSRDSQNSIEAVRASPRSIPKMDEKRQEIESIKSTSSSYLDELFCEPLETQSSFSGTKRLESITSVSSSGSSFTVDSSMPSMSAQCMQLVRVNSRRIGGYDSIDSATYSDSFSQWPSIGEDTSLGMEALQIAQIDTQITEPREPLETDLEETPSSPEVKRSIKTESPFRKAQKAREKTPPPKPNRTMGTGMVPPAPMKSAFKESVTEARPLSRISEAPPPPPLPSPKRNLPVKAPPPPPKGTAKGKPGANIPPPPSNNGSRRNRSNIVRSSKVIEIFQQFRQKKGFKSSHKRKKTAKEVPVEKSLRSEGSGEGLIRELETRSSFFAQIQTDITTHGATIERIIQDINTKKFETMAELNAFVKKIDDLLETFEDETAVLKHFDWPQKYYVYREALALWSEFKTRTAKCRNWPMGNRETAAELHKMRKSMEMMIRRVDDVKRTIETDVKKFMRNGIPWDSHIIQKAHDGTMCLLEKYMQIVYDEVNRMQSKATHRESNLQYLSDTINLTFKIHQCVGGLTESCTSLFEKIATFTQTLSSDL